MIFVVMLVVIFRYVMEDSCLVTTKDISSTEEVDYF